MVVAKAPIPRGLSVFENNRSASNATPEFRSTFMLLQNCRKFFLAATMISWRASLRPRAAWRMFSTVRDPYEVLGVPHSASHEDIKAQFRVLAKKYHPDLNTHDANASKLMADLTNAYDLLTDKRRRAEFDRQRSTGSAFSGTTGANAEWVDPSQMFSEFSNIFGRMGRGTSTRPAGRAAVRGADISTSVEIDFLDAMNGCVRPISVRAKETCVPCHGSGARPGTGWTNCKTCNGTGTQRVERGIMTMGMPCVRCGGAGQVIEHACVSCKGEGSRVGSKEVIVKIPAGIKSSMELRVQSHGDCGARGGRSGDLFVTVKVKPDEYFSVIDDDVHVDVPLTIGEVLLGTSVAIRPIQRDGKPIPVQIPSGTLPGTTRTLKGKGPPRPNSGGSSRGDIVLRFSLSLPQSQSFSPEQLQLITELEKSLYGKK